MSFFKKLSAFSLQLTEKLIRKSASCQQLTVSHSQKGFASQILLLLLLVGGIGLGTYLVQQRTNITPQALTSKDFVCVRGDIGTDNLSQCKGNGQIMALTHCHYKLRMSDDSEQSGGFSSTLSTCDDWLNRIGTPFGSGVLSSVNFVCHWEGPQCPSQAAPAARTTPYCDSNTGILYREDGSSDYCAKGCTGADGRAVCVTEGQSTVGTDSGQQCTPDEKTRCNGQGGSSCEVTKTQGKFCVDTRLRGACQGTVLGTVQNGIFTATGDCKNNTDSRKTCGFDAEAKAYACIAPSATTPSRTEAVQPGATRNCLGDEKNKANGELICSTGMQCVIDTVGSKWCIDPTLKEGGACPSDIANSCKPKYGLNDCSIVNGLPRCLYPDVAKDTDCKESCSTGFSCKLWPVTVNGVNKKVSYCASTTSGAATAAPPATAIVPALTEQAAAGSGSTTGSGGSSAMATTVNPDNPCSDPNGNLNGIPCYKIGIFDDKELASTKADAAQAAKRYETYTKVLGEISEYIGDLKGKVEEKNAAAQKAAQACLAQ